MKDDFKVTYNVKNMPEDKKKNVENLYKDIILSTKDDLALDLSNLHSVVLTDNYKEELKNLESIIKDKSKLTYTDNGLAIGIGKSISFNENGYEKEIVVLSETFLEMTKKEEYMLFGLNILAHELAHIDDRNKKKIYIKDFEEDSYSSYDDKVYYPLVKNSWNEFYANYKASPYLEKISLESSNKNFFDALNSFDKNVLDKKWEYQNGIISMEKFLESFRIHAYHLFNQASYLLGNIIGLNISTKNYLEKIEKNIENTIMENTLFEMEIIFKKLIDKYPKKWNGVCELEALKECLMNYYADIGIIFEEEFCHIKFTKYGHQPYKK